jgi:curved DNA-binding protein CbpA
MQTKDPYLLLGLQEHVTDSEVTDAYHAALRRHPPEREPERFTAISEAYESIRTEKDRVRRRLFPAGIPADALSGYFDVPDAGHAPVAIKCEHWLREARKQWARSRLS